MTDAWKTLNSRIGFDGGWWKLRLDRCQTPADIIIDDYPVLEYPDWVTTVALRKGDEKVILTSEYRHAIGKSVLGLPGGGVEPEEIRDGGAGIEAAAIRELSEETGHLASRVMRIATLLPNAATHNNRLFAFVARDVVPGNEASIDEEAGKRIALKYMELDELVARLQTGEIEMESGHVAAIYAALAYLRSDSPSA